MRLIRQTMPTEMSKAREYDFVYRVRDGLFLPTLMQYEARRRERRWVVLMALGAMVSGAFLILDF